MDNMNQQLISQIYDKVFYDNEDVSKASINLEGVSLDIYADSENESEMKDEIKSHLNKLRQQNHHIKHKKSHENPITLQTTILTTPKQLHLLEKPEFHLP